MCEAHGSLRGAQHSVEAPLASGSSLTALHSPHIVARTPASGAFQEEKNALREALTAHDAARDKQREELKAARGTLRFRSEGEIDAECARLEATIAHSTMPLAEEKKLLLQIKELQKQKGDVAGVADRQAKLSDGDEGRKALVDRIKAKDGEVEAVKAQKNALQAQLQAQRSKEEALVGDLPALQAEREATWTALQAARAAQRQLRDQHKAAEDVWWANEKVWRQQQRDEKQKKCVVGTCCPDLAMLMLTRALVSGCQSRWEESQAERKARNEARRKYEEENAPLPFAEEVLLCDQLSAYLATWVPDAPTASAPEAAAAPHSNGHAAPAKRAVEAPTAKMLVSKKNQVDEEMYAVGGKAGKGGKGGKSAAASAAATNAGAASSAAQPPSVPPPQQQRSANERLSHSLDALASFTKVGMVPPSTVGEISKAKGDVASKKAKYLDQRVGALAKQAAQRAARDAAEAEGREYVPPQEEGEAAQPAAQPPTETATGAQDVAAAAAGAVGQPEGAAPEAAVAAVGEPGQGKGGDEAEAAPLDARVSLTLSVPEEDRVEVDMEILV
jgi:hypothetical protein